MNKTTKEESPFFTAFYKNYPNRKARVVAERSWNKLKPDYDLRKKIYKSVEAQKKTDQWQKGMIPLPATFLNQKRWNDEVTSLFEEPKESPLKKNPYKSGETGYLEYRRGILSVNPIERAKRLHFFNNYYFGITGKKEIPDEMAPLVISAQEKFFTENPKRIHPSFETFYDILKPEEGKKTLGLMPLALMIQADKKYAKFNK